MGSGKPLRGFKQVPYYAPGTVLSAAIQICKWQGDQLAIKRVTGVKGTADTCYVPVISIKSCNPLNDPTKLELLSPSL